MWGRCLTLTHSMPWFGHTVQNRDIAIDALEGNVAYQQRWLRRRAARSPSFQDLIRTGDDANCRCRPGSPFGPAAIGTKQPLDLLWSIGGRGECATAAS